MIRPFSFDDLDRVLQIERQAFPKSPYDWATFVNLHYLYPETFLVYVNTANHRGEEPLGGYIIFSPDGHIISIAVHPRHRRKGIGKELIQRAMNPPHLKRVWAEVRKSNQGAQAFYLHMGFQRTGVILNYYGDEDAWVVQWIPASPQVLLTR